MLNCYEILKGGAVIEIKPHTEENKSFSPAKFYTKDGRVFAYNDAIGNCDWSSQWKDEAEAEKRFNNHIKNMIAEHFQIIISA